MQLLPWLLLLLLCKVIMCRVSGQMHERASRSCLVDALPDCLTRELSHWFFPTEISALSDGIVFVPVSQLAQRPRGSFSPIPRVACMHTTSGAIGCSRFHRFGGGAPLTGIDLVRPR